ncbi:MAG: hypothetical protein FJY10_11940, partial [Bacteroidetes bacterium]|nr:hypothetical protein [Bacteroidota bacterium]
LGKGIYEYLADNPEASAVFNRSMHDISQLSIDPLLHAYDFSTYKSLIDVGGGKGMVLSAILRRYPRLNGAIVDLPDAIRDAPDTLTTSDVSSRVKLIPGSFFDTIPEGGDGYILKNILHNWDDEKCLKILQNIHHAAIPGGKVIIIENVVNKPNQPSFAKLIDLQMLVSFPGAKERTLDEYTELLVKSGFTDIRITRTIAPFSVIDARK